MTITKVEPRRRSLKAIWLDDMPVGEIDAQTWEYAGYRVGNEIGREQFDALKEQSDYNRAKSRALWFLARRSYCRKELIEKVAKETGYPAAGLAVGRMQELGLVNDADYAARYGADLIHFKHYSKNRAALELIKKGVERDVAMQALEEIESDPVEQAVQVLQKKYAASLMDEKGRRRAIAGLQRLGYRWADIQQAMKRMAQDDFTELEQIDFGKEDM